MLLVKPTIKDHWRDWPKEFSAPPAFDRDAYQTRLNEITGLSRGMPILKLVWGGEEGTAKYSEWDSFGTPQKSHIVPTYSVTRKNPILDHIEYVPIRRWIIVERAEPEFYGLGSDDDNTFTNEYGVDCKPAEKPVELYTPYIYIGDHSNCPTDCCAKRICFGGYKPPSAWELDLILEHTYKLSKDKFINPYSRLSAETKAHLNLEKKHLKEIRDQEFDDHIKEEAKDWWNAHSHRITEDDPSVLSRGKYRHFYKDGKPL
jgi:hypothetical protein